MIDTKLNDAVLYDLLKNGRAHTFFCGQDFAIMVVEVLNSTTERTVYSPKNDVHNEYHILFITKAEVIELLRMGVVLIEGFRRDTLRIEATN